MITHLNELKYLLCFDFSWWNLLHIDLFFSTAFSRHQKAQLAQSSKKKKKEQVSALSGYPWDPWKWNHTLLERFLTSLLCTWLPLLELFRFCSQGYCVWTSTSSNSLTYSPFLSTVSWSDSSVIVSHFFCRAAQPFGPTRPSPIPHCQHLFIYFFSWTWLQQ